jgi:DNA-binding response OmpR family regulator
MKTIHLLLASSDRRAGNLVQAVVLDACYNQAAVETIRASRIDELMALGCRDGIDLVVLTPGKLQPTAKSQSPVITTTEVGEAIATLKRYSVRPVLVVDARTQDETAFRNAGADGVFSFPFDGGALKQKVHRVLKMTEAPEPGVPERPSLAGLLLRGLQRLKSA